MSKHLGACRVSPTSDSGFTLTGFTTDYVEVPISEAARKALKAGGNTVAIHCKQTGGGQYIDAGLQERK
ncbi:MAG: hypothetical protein U0791_14075 [Gemmataceae bacterium]